MSRFGSARDYPVYSVVGDRYAFLLTGDQTGGAYAVIEAFVPPGGGPPTHVHRREDEVFVIVAGEFEFHVAGESIRVGAGEAVTVSRGTPHNFRNIGPEPARMIVTVTPAGLERFFAEVGTRLEDREAAPFPPTPEHFEEIARVLPAYDFEIVPEPALHH